ncbi:protein IRON-RELATED TRANSCRIPTION FACTOR 2-like [Papaver somniferum]|uniref:protein IRON-RELATED TRANSCRIPTION FACTOR 2-like n=1 Tax=Papaver somniferum TaxID=3469 RepID=UPI000E705C87|nr:protein IRON-RELATED TRANSCRIPTION FACTOR 2-like [Papaver somniferum]
MAIRIGAGCKVESQLPLMLQNVDNGIHGCADEDPTNMFASTTAPSLSNSQETKATKKFDHNAKEKLRRTKLNDAYSSLKSLLPDAYLSKKKWSYPIVVAKVLEYIPELQEEIKKLKQKKDNILLSSQEKQNRMVSSAGLYSGPTVSTVEINKGEIISQICVLRQLDVFPLLLENLEREGIRIANASTLSISAERMKGHSDQPTQYVDNLRNKIVSWLLPGTL